MANRQKRTGTDGENAVVELLQSFGVKAVRADEAPIGAHEPSWDVYLPDLPGIAIEVKRRKTLAMPDWIRKAVAALTGDTRRHVWALWVLPRDRRRKDALPGFVAVDEDFFAMLLRAYWEASYEDLDGAS